MRMTMLVAMAGYIGGELGCVQPGQAYESVSENEARSLYLAGAALPESGEIPPSWIEPIAIVSPETLPTSGSLVALPDGFTITPATDQVEPGEISPPGADDPTDVTPEPVPAPAAAPAKPRRTRKAAATK